MIKIDNIQYKGGGTSFASVFEAATKIIRNYLHLETMYLIFMTDG